MGSVVKSIGRVFKKAGKALKKIAPVLLVAAAAYVGYGFATGFSGGGWPKITGWGKSLMRGIRGGSTLSQAASQASQGITGEVATSAVTTPASFPPDVVAQAADPFAFEDARAAASQASQGMLGGTPTISPSGDYMAMGPFGGGGSGMINYTSLSGGTPDPVGLTARDIRGRAPSLYEVLFNPPSEQLIHQQVANPNDFEFNSVLEIPASQATLEPVVVTASPSDVASQSATGAATGAATNPYIGNPAFETRQRYFGGDLTGEDALLADTTGAQLTGNDFISIFKDKAGKAWQFYKDLWKNDPMIALYGTNKVIQMVAAMLAEDEKDKRYEFGGFDPNVSYADMAKNLRSKGLPMPKAKPGTVFGPGRGLLSPQGANV